MRVLLINDTRIENNPGCHATVNELILFIKENLKVSKLETLPVGTSYNIFESKDLFKRSYLSKIKSKLLKPNSPYFNLTKWKEIVQNDISDEVKQKIDSSDIVIINMEGTIHHNSIGALTLLAFAYYSNMKGKKTAMVNGSFQEVNKKLTDFVLKKVNFLSVRDSCSYKLLKLRFEKLNLIPDFAFRAKINQEYIKPDIFFDTSNKKRCLYTAGVLAVYPQQKGGVNFSQIENHIAQIRNIGFEPYFLMVEKGENLIENKLRNLDVKTISYSDGVNYKNIGTLLESFDLLITGRYHIGIFGLMSKIRTYFLPSNTYKIEGLLEFLKLDGLLITNNQILNIESQLETNSDFLFNVADIYDEYEPFRLFLESV